MRIIFLTILLIILPALLYSEIKLTTPVTTIENFEDNVLRLISEGRQHKAEILVQNASPNLQQHQRYLFIKACLDRSRFMIIESSKTFDEVILIYPYSTDGYASFLIRELDRGHNSEKNWSELKKLSSTNSDSIWLKWMLGVIARSLDKNQEGIKIYSELLATQKVGSSLMHQTYANMLDQIEDFEQSLVHRRLAVSLEDKSWSRDGLANTLVSLHRYDEAIENYKKAIQLDANNTNTRLNYGLTLINLSRFSDAASVIEPAAHINPNWDTIWYSWGIALEGLGKVDEALVKYKRALELNPNHGSARMKISNLTKNGQSGAQ